MLGIHPEYIAFGEEDETSLLAEIEMLTNVGADKYIHDKVDGVTIIARAHKNAIPMQERLFVLKSILANCTFSMRTDGLVDLWALRSFC